MFVERLTADERSALVALAERLAMTDGSVTAHEVERLEALRREAGDVRASSSNPATLAAAFTSPSSRRIALLELHAIALADLHLHEQEARFLNDLRAAFGVPAAEAEALKSWVIRELALREEAEVLLRG